VGHHRSKNSTKPDFLAAVGPQVAINSAGKENLDLHLVSLERLGSAGVGVLRTDLNGSVTMLTEGDKIEFLASSPARNPLPAKG
jgi:competence protein ComEC